MAPHEEPDHRAGSRSRPARPTAWTSSTTPDHEVGCDCLSDAAARSSRRGSPRPRRGQPPRRDGRVSVPTRPRATNPAWTGSRTPDGSRGDDAARGRAPRRRVGDAAPGSPGPGCAGRPASPRPRAALAGGRPDDEADPRGARRQPRRGARRDEGRGDEARPAAELRRPRPAARGPQRLPRRPGQAARRRPAFDPDAIDEVLTEEYGAPPTPCSRRSTRPRWPRPRSGRSTRPSSTTARRGRQGPVPGRRRGRAGRPAQRRAFAPLARWSLPQPGDRAAARRAPRAHRRRARLRARGAVPARLRHRYAGHPSSTSPTSSATCAASRCCVRAHPRARFDDARRDGSRRRASSASARSSSATPSARSAASGCSTATRTRATTS
jgi:hypothetical protein